MKEKPLITILTRFINISLIITTIILTTTCFLLYQSTNNVILNSITVNNSVPNIFSRSKSTVFKVVTTKNRDSTKILDPVAKSSRLKRSVKRTKIRKRGMKGGKGKGMADMEFNDNMKKDMKKLMKMKMKYKMMKKKKKMMWIKSKMKKIPKKEKCDKKGIKLVKIQRIEYKKVPVHIPYDEMGQMYGPGGGKEEKAEPETSFGYKKKNSFKYPLPEPEEFMKKDYHYKNYGDYYGGDNGNTPDVVYTGDYYESNTDYGGNPDVEYVG